VDLDESQWRSWPSPGSSAEAFAVPAQTEQYECPDVSTESLVGRAVDCAREWGVLGDKTAAAEDIPNQPVTAENIWRNPDAHPMVLATLLIDKYGQSVVEWMPITLQQTLEKDGILLSNSAYAKVLSAFVMIASPSPWRRWEVFHWVARGLSGQQPNIVYLETPELGHLFVMADMMKLLDPKRQSGIEVDKYVAATLAEDGIHYAPPPLDFSQRELDDAKIQCERCNTVNRDDGDVRCVSCGNTKLTKLPGEFDVAKKATEALWNARKGLPIVRAVDGLPDSGPGNAVYRLLVHWDYARRVRSQMIQQLRAVGSRR
jgi:hypothetical protein